MFFELFKFFGLDVINVGMYLGNGEWLSVISGELIILVNLIIGELIVQVCVIIEVEYEIVVVCV